MALCGLFKKEQQVIETSIITHVTPVGRNIFTDLGFDPEEAEALLAETDKGILSELPQPAVSSS